MAFSASMEGVSAARRVGGGYCRAGAWEQLGLLEKPQAIHSGSMGTLLVTRVEEREEKVRIYYFSLESVIIAGSEVDLGPR